VRFAVEAVLEGNHERAMQPGQFVHEEAGGYRTLRPAPARGGHEPAVP
jgi:hypothetical protein